jgi:phytoene desaturase
MKDKNKNPKKILIIGAGPGGLAAGMLLARRGHLVTIFEKHGFVGGRTSTFTMEGFRFDLGSTFLIMKSVFEELFHKVGRELDVEMDLQNIDPLYRLVYPEGKEFHPSSDREKMKKEMARCFPEEEGGYQAFLDKESIKYQMMVPFLKQAYDNPRIFFQPGFLMKLPGIDAHISLYRKLGQYFKGDLLKQAFTFQSKYLGMSPWHCPGTFSIIPFIEHRYGIFHPIGGLGALTKTMGRIFQEEGGTLLLNQEVTEVLVEQGEAKGLQLKDGKQILGDCVIMNADFSKGMEKLVPERHRKKYTDKKLRNMKYSCSTFMIYLGLNRQYDFPHHQVLFSSDYKKNMNQLTRDYQLPEDPAVYLQNPWKTDPTLAPPGKSTLYILVPVPNNRSKIPWDTLKEQFKEEILDLVEKRGGYPRLREAIEVEKIITPKDWEEEMDLYFGATFSLSHNINQMLYYRPHNRYEDVKDLYLVGGSTHPGSGLPTILISAAITSELIDGIRK